jgi:predicted CopG family antitoxin
MFADPNRTTTIAIKTSTLRTLRQYKVGGASYDDILIELMEETPPDTFWAEVRRREEEPANIPVERVLKKAGLRW